VDRNAVNSPEECRLHQWADLHNTNTCAEQSQVDSNKNLLVPTVTRRHEWYFRRRRNWRINQSRFDASPDLLADMSGSTGGTAVARAEPLVLWLFRTGGTGGAPGTGGSVGPNPDASQILPPTCRAAPAA